MVNAGRGFQAAQPYSCQYQFFKKLLEFVEIDCSMKTQKNEINNAHHQVIPWHLADFGAEALVNLACGSWGGVFIRDLMVAVMVTPEPASWAGGW